MMDRDDTAFAVVTSYLKEIGMSAVTNRFGETRLIPSRVEAGKRRVEARKGSEVRLSAAEAKRARKAALRLQQVQK